jgi:oxygen-independent coproporphyrinogen-3 oxidase
MIDEPLSLPEAHLGLYVHVPFCVRKCAYCDFASEPLGGQAEAYLDALAREAAGRRPLVDRPVASIYLGGGTPTALSGTQLRRLWEMVAPFPRTDDAEITLEANPGTLTDDVLDALAALPLTRVSLGVQSFHAAELATLGRIHTPAQVGEAVAALRAIGVPQLNLDLMYGLPGQTPASWDASLAAALALAPDHLSLYALMVEDGTPLAAQVGAGILPLPGEEEETAMDAQAAARLDAAGYRRYEVSNAARPGRHSRHNLGYWLGRDYLGLGTAAVSCLDGVRWRNVAAVADYTARAAADVPVLDYVERLAPRPRLLERAMLGLRLRGGFDLAAAEAACGAMLARDVLDVLQAEGLLARDGDMLRLTSAGFPVANQVTARLTAAEK